MKKKRGLSLEDKRNILMSLFKKNPTFFNGKEIEKHLTSNKISFMIVKDLIAGVVADNLIETEKIGSSSYFWSLPSRVYEGKKKNLEREEKRIIETKEELKNLDEKIKENKASRVENDERKNNLEELAELEKEIKKNEKIIQDFEDKDPEKYDQYTNTAKQLEKLKEFWIDNIYTIEQWMRSKRPDIEFEKMFPAVQDLHLFD